MLDWLWAQKNPPTDVLRDGKGCEVPACPQAHPCPCEEDEGKHRGEEEQNTVAYRTTIQATETMVYRGTLRKPLLSTSWTNIPVQQ